jgi:hypothetical protein
MMGVTLFRDEVLAIYTVFIHGETFISGGISPPVVG